MAPPRPHGAERAEGPRGKRGDAVERHRQLDGRLGRRRRHRLCGVARRDTRRHGHGAVRRPRRPRLRHLVVVRRRASRRGRQQLGRHDPGRRDRRLPAQRRPRERVPLAHGQRREPCTAAAPCKTFDRGYRVAPARADVELAAGAYGSQTHRAPTGQDVGDDVVIRPAAGASVDHGLAHRQRRPRDPARLHRSTAAGRPTTRPTTSRSATSPSTAASSSTRRPTSRSSAAPSAAPWTRTRSSRPGR